MIGVMPGNTLSSVGDESSELDNAKLPALDKKMAKRKVAVFRTRSRLERDVWCWALNSEIEKVVKASKDREIKIRDSGGLVKL
jgi:hypothetical protein